jgi:hypothetical protein
MVELQLPKLMARVRFPSLALVKFFGSVSGWAYTEEDDNQSESSSVAS